MDDRFYLCFNVVPVIDAWSRIQTESQVVVQSIPLFDRRSKNCQPAILQMMKTSSSGTETLSGTVLTFFILMACSQDVQERVIQEIVSSVTRNRLPGPQDRHALRFVDAVVQESQNSEEDLDFGQSLGHDTHETVYPDSDKFLPEQFMSNRGTTASPDARTMIFGFGRRRCPGTGSEAVHVQIRASLQLPLSNFSSWLQLKRAGTRIFMETKSLKKVPQGRSSWRRREGYKEHSSSKVGAQRSTLASVQKMSAAFFADPVIVLSVFSVVLLSILYSVGRWYNLGERGPVYPPGPPAKPLLGNILTIPKNGAWRLFQKFHHQYGDLVFFHGLGNTVLVLNTMKAINDLLDRRGDIYSHRPEFTVVGELMGLNRSMPNLPYGKEWREQRKLAHLALNSTAVKKYHIVQEDLAALMNKDLLERPEDFFAHARLTSERIVLSVTYGLPIDSSSNVYVTHAEATMKIIGEATVPGAYLCDLMPFMKYLPSWVPFQKEARRGRYMIEHLVTIPFEHVKKQMAEGTAAPSLTQDLLRLEKPDMENFEHRVKWTTGSMYGAGGETTYAIILIFILAMVLHPEKQRLAQEEIDKLIGGERLPVIADLPHLPYVNAVIKETMRWHPAIPLGIARRSGQDDTYEGYFIPKGTIIIPNVWAISLEPSNKYDPYKFIPERFLDPTQAIVDPATGHLVSEDGQCLRCLMTVGRVRYIPTRGRSDSNIRSQPSELSGPIQLQHSSTLRG
ncbi:O-methylsterigmatocystin oxidoreductase [Grifola frondosa]|uniref:O-methylsterigmatocystin oxidoreductase n=1 Tax=Grifola frondosa TaxID=5627 RepID=A0A1C7MCZ1_GRIFR|nr:O-methylsterigmatocystin oxidoreductase [Grifola frondosa]